MADDLQIRENTRFQKRVWRVQPVIWCLMLLFVAIGFFGTFGGAGPLNKTSVSERHVKIEFERFPIKTIPTVVTVQIDSAFADEVDLWLNDDYLARMVLKHLYPNPERSRTRDGGTSFTFSVTAGQPATLSLVFEPQSSGRATSDYRIRGAATVKISHLVYP